jgi:hypothetical protein
MTPSQLLHKIKKISESEEPEKLMSINHLQYHFSILVTNGAGGQFIIIPKCLGFERSGARENPVT